MQSRGGRRNLYVSAQGQVWYSWDDRMCVASQLAHKLPLRRGQEPNHRPQCEDNDITAD